MLCLSASQGYGTIVSLHNSGGELCLYTIQGDNCASTQFRGIIVSLHNSGGELCLYTIQGRDCSSLQYLGVFHVDLQAVPS
jgi:hypothetical protein